MVTNTAYFREFLDFSFLWMRENGKSVDENYLPRPRNVELWQQLKAICPADFFTKCPIHFFGDPISNPERKVLSISLQPGRPEDIENKEDEMHVFSEFGLAGSAITTAASGYFRLVYGNNPPNINVGKGFWRKIARIGHAASTGQSLNGSCRNWVFSNLVHVDFWSLRAKSDDEYEKIRNVLPVGFQKDDRKEMLIELINAMKPMLTLVLGSKINLGLDANVINDLDSNPVRYRWVRKYRHVADCFATVHPSTRGMTNEDLDEIGITIYSERRTQ